MVSKLVVWIWFTFDHSLHCTLERSYFGGKVRNIHRCGERSQVHGIYGTGICNISIYQALMHQLPNLKALATLQVMFMMCEQCTGSHSTQPLIYPEKSYGVLWCCRDRLWHKWYALFSCWSPILKWGKYREILWISGSAWTTWNAERLLPRAYRGQGCAEVFMKCMQRK